MEDATRHMTPLIVADWLDGAHPYLVSQLLQVTRITMVEYRRLQKVGKHYSDYVASIKDRKKHEHEVTPPTTKHGRQQSYKVPDLGFKVFRENKNIITYIHKLDKRRKKWGET